MIETREPVNKQAALFLSRKGRVRSISEALEKFVAKLSVPNLSEGINDLIKQEKAGYRCGFALTIYIHPDPTTPDRYSVKLTSQVTRDYGSENYFGLEVK